MHRLSTETAAALRHFAETGEWTEALSDGEIRIVDAELPGRAVIGAARLGEVLWVIIDVGKPEAMRHLGRLLDGWPLGRGPDGAPVTSTLTIVDALELLRPFVRLDDCPPGPVVIREVTPR